MLEGQDDAGAGNSTGAVVEEKLPSARSPDSDFDDLLASYVDGAEEGEGGVFGKTGGSLLMPLGALRLLRWVLSTSERKERHKQKSVAALGVHLSNMSRTTRLSK